MPSRRRRDRFLLAALAVAALLCACDLILGGPDEQPYALPWPTTPVDSFEADPVSGGSVVIAGEPALDGVSVAVPAGAVSAPTTITVGLAPDAPELDVPGLLLDSPEAMDSLVERALVLAERSSDGRLIHPLLYPLAMIGAEFEPAGPALALEPTGTTFEVPVVVSLPPSVLELQPPVDAEDVVAFVTAPGPNGTTVWEVVPDLDVDAQGNVVVELDHFSVLRFVKRQGWRAAGIVVAPLMTLPEVPLMTERLVQAMACTGIEPRLDASRIPWGPDLLNYLMNPVISEPGSWNPFIRYWSMRGVPDDVEDQAGFQRAMEDMGFLNGHEFELETWVRGQGEGEVAVEDLFAQAYRLADGDWYQAVLLCHNTLRGLKYGPGYGNRSDATIQSRMAPMVDSGDAVGHRYHLFGMMLWGIAQGTNSFRNLPGNFEDNMRWFQANLTTYLEEAVVSGDILTDPHEAAFDMEGFRVGNDLVDHVFNHSLSEIRDGDLLIEGCGDVEVSVSADPTSAELGEFIFFTSEVSGGELPYVYTWEFGDGATSALSADSHAWSTEGAYTVTLTVEDALGDRGTGSVQVRIGAGAVTGEEFVVWYTDNVRCWDAPSVYLTVRANYEREEPTCSFSGGGVDCSIMVEKTIWADGFATHDEGRDWACAQFTHWTSHAWCGAHYWAGGQPYRPGSLGCDFSDLPEGEN